MRTSLQVGIIVIFRLILCCFTSHPIEYFSKIVKYPNYGNWGQIVTWLFHGTNQLRNIYHYILILKKTKTRFWIYQAFSMLLTKLGVACTPLTPYSKLIIFHLLKKLIQFTSRDTQRQSTMPKENEYQTFSNEGFENTFDDLEHVYSNMCTVP